MNISSTRVLTTSTPLTKQPVPNVEQEAESGEPQEKYEAWMPFANAGVVGALVAVPAALGAIGNALFPDAGPIAKGAMVLGLATAAATGAGMWAINDFSEEFNGHPILTGMGGLMAGGAAFVGTAALSPIGVSYGWTGAAVATGAAAVGAGVISAVGMYAAGKQEG